MGEKLAADHNHEEIEREDGDWKHFLFDPENRTVLGRTASSWLSVTIFYAIYYTFIAILSYYCVMGYQNQMLVFPSAKNAHPTTQTRVSTPGVAAFPGVEQIVIDANRVSGFSYIDRINSRMQQWMNRDSEANAAKLAQLGECSPVCADTSSDCVNPPLAASYAAGSPCIYYQINKVMNWKPFPYHSLNDKHITPRVKPEDDEETNSLVYNAVDKFENDKVYFFCYDLDLVRGFVNETDRMTATYYSTDDENSNAGKPYGIFNFNNWPIPEGKAIKEVQNPVVAVKIDINEKYHNSLVNVACQAYAANLGPNEQINEAFAVMPITVMAAGDSTISAINKDYRDGAADGVKEEN